MSKVRKHYRKLGGGRTVDVKQHERDNDRRSYTVYVDHRNKRYEALTRKPEWMTLGGCAINRFDIGDMLVESYQEGQFEEYLQVADGKYVKFTKVEAEQIIAYAKTETPKLLQILDEPRKQKGKP